MKRWMLSIVVTLMALAPVAAEASRSQSSLIKSTILASAQSTSPVDYNSSDNAWNLIRAARRYATNGQLTQATEALVQAEQRTRLLSNSATLEQLLGKIAAEHAKLGQYDRAIAVTTSMGYTTLPSQACCVSVRTEAEIAIAEAYIQAGQINQAQQFAERIESAPSRYQVFVPIVVALAEQGRFADAIALSKRINDASQASRARYGIAKGYISADRVLEGVEFAQSVVDPSERLSLLTVLSQWASRSGQYDRAYRIANQIQDAGTKVQVLTDVAIAYANAGQRERASTILSQAYGIARKQSQPQAFAQWVGNFAQIGAFDRALEIAARLKDYDGGEARLSIARAYSNAGQYDKALASAQQVQDGALQPLGDLPDPKVAVLNQIVKQAADAGQYDRAIRAAQSFNRAQNRVRPLQVIARRYRATNQFDKGVNVLSQAVQAAKSVDKIVIFYDRNTYFAVSNAGLLVDLARDYVKFNQPDRAIALLDEALGSARTLKETNISSVREQVRYLSEIANLYGQLNQRDRAVAAAESAFNLVDQFPTDVQSVYRLSWKVQALADVARIFYTAGVGQRANELLLSAQTLSDRITDNQQRVWAGMSIVQAYAAMGEESRVKETVEGVLTLAQSLESFRRDWLIDRLAVAAASSDPAYAIQLAQSQPDRARQIPTLAQMATNYHAAGQAPQAQAVVVRLQQVAETVPNDEQREQMLSDAVRNYFVPQNARDLPVTQLLHAGQINADIQAPNVKAGNWALIAQAYAVQGEAGRATEAMGFALETIKTISNRSDRRELLWQLFEEALRAGERSLAAQIANGFEAAYRTTALQRVDLHSSN